MIGDPDRPSKSSAIRVAVADDHEHIHQAVQYLLASTTDIELVGWAKTGHEAVRLCEIMHPDIILMDVIMPEMDGIKATQLIHGQFPDIKILVLSSYQDDEKVHAMLRSGASAYIVKGALPQDLIPTIHATHAGQTVLSSEIASRLLQATAPPLAHIDLTERELEVLGLMAAGLTNGEIAFKLSISQSTVKFHIANILGRMGVDTRAEALVVASRHNLI